MSGAGLRKPSGGHLHCGGGVAPRSFSEELTGEQGSERKGSSPGGVGTGAERSGEAEEQFVKMLSFGRKMTFVL